MGASGCPERVEGSSTDFCTAFPQSVLPRIDLRQATVMPVVENLAGQATQPVQSITDQQGGCRKSLAATDYLEKTDK